MTELDLEPGEELIQSRVAARLNGYTNGYGTKVRNQIIFDRVVI